MGFDSWFTRTRCSGYCHPVIEKAAAPGNLDLMGVENEAYDDADAHIGEAESGLRERCGRRDVGVEGRIKTQSHETANGVNCVCVSVNNLGPRYPCNDAVYT